MITRINPYKLSNRYNSPTASSKYRSNPTFGFAPDKVVTGLAKDRPRIITEALKKIVKELYCNGFESTSQAILKPEENIILKNLYIEAKRNGMRDISVNVTYANSKDDGGSVVGIINIAKGTAEKVLHTMQDEKFLKSVIEKLKKTSDNILFNRSSRLED